MKWFLQGLFISGTAAVIIWIVSLAYYKPNAYKYYATKASRWMVYIWLVTFGYYLGISKNQDMNILEVFNESAVPLLISIVLLAMADIHKLRKHIDKHDEDDPSNTKPKSN